MAVSVKCAGRNRPDLSGSAWNDDLHTGSLSLDERLPQQMPVALVKRSCSNINEHVHLKDQAAKTWAAARCPRAGVISFRSHRDGSYRWNYGKEFVPSRKWRNCRARAASTRIWSCPGRRRTSTRSIAPRRSAISIASLFDSTRWSSPSARGPGSLQSTSHDITGSSSRLATVPNRQGIRPRP